MIQPVNTYGRDRQCHTSQFHSDRKQCHCHPGWKLDAAVYTAEFEEMWGITHRSAGNIKAKIRTQKVDNCPHILNIARHSPLRSSTFSHSDRCFICPYHLILTKTTKVYRSACTNLFCRLWKTLCTLFSCRETDPRGV